MKKLVFLHGSGSDKNAYGELMKQVAKQFDAELFSFNAPYPHPSKSGKFMWFNKFEQNNRRDAVIKDYYHSLEYIKNKILALGESFDNIILAGHSQGGGMAVHVGLELKLNKVISISGDLPYNIEYEKKENRHPAKVKTDKIFSRFFKGNGYIGLKVRTILISIATAKIRIKFCKR